MRTTRSPRPREPVAGVGRGRELGPSRGRERRQEAALGRLDRPAIEAEDRRAALPGLDAERLHERRLPHARETVDEDDQRPVVTKQPAQDAQLVLAPDQSRRLLFDQVAGRSRSSMESARGCQCGYRLDPGPESEREDVDGHPVSFHRWPMAVTVRRAGLPCVPGT